jgi:hypothetical protein
VDAHHGSCDGGAGRVEDYPFDGAGIAERLSKNPMREREKKHTHGTDSENSSHGSSIGRVALWSRTNSHKWAKIRWGRAGFADERTDERTISK